jgi:hypothetical protein
MLQIGLNHVQHQHHHVLVKKQALLVQYQHQIVMVYKVVVLPVHQEEMHHHHQPVLQQAQVELVVPVLKVHAWQVHVLVLLVEVHQETVLIHATQVFIIMVQCAFLTVLIQVQATGS